MTLQQEHNEYRVEYPVSAGGVVYRIAGEGIEIVTCGQQSPNKWIWALPKGTPDPGETLEETALREVKEETGLSVKIESQVGRIQYWFESTEDKVKYHKTVYFYLMSSTGGSFENHDHEFDTVQWSVSSDALSSLTYKDETNIVAKALTLISKSR